MARKAVLFCLVVVLALSALAVTACGGGSGTSEESAKAAVQADLSKIDAAVADLTQKGTSGALTVAGIKAARDSLKPLIEDVITQAKNIKGADVAAVQKAWQDLDAAITALPDSATLMDAAGVLLTKVTPLTNALAQIKALVTPST